MATHKTRQFPFKWPDGSYHSRPAKNQGIPRSNPTIFGGGPTPGWGAPKPPPPRPGTTAPTRPVAPGAPSPVGQPFVGDSIYQNDVGLADRQLSATNASLSAQEQNVKFDYGLDDPTNPNSRAAALKRAFLTRSNGDINGAGQHIFAGSTKRAIERTRRDREFAGADLRRAYEQALAGIKEQRSTAGFNTEAAKAQAMKDAIDRAPAAEGKLPAPPAPKPPKPAPPKPPKPPHKPKHKPPHKPPHNPKHAAGSFGGGKLGPGAKSLYKPRKKKH